MNREQLGDPDLVIERLSIWVDGPEFCDANDFWDGNWLRITAHYASQTASVTARGPILHLSDIVSFIEEVNALQALERTTAHLGSIEPNLKVKLEQADRLGHINVMIDITSDHMTEEHRFHSQIDVTYLPPSSVPARNC